MATVVGQRDRPYSLATGREQAITTPAAAKQLMAHSGREAAVVRRPCGQGGGVGPTLAMAVSSSS